MGTRHLIATKIDGVYKLAQYGQWDGYPDCWQAFLEEVSDNGKD